MQTMIGVVGFMMVIFMMAIYWTEMQLCLIAMLGVGLITIGIGFYECLDMVNQTIGNTYQACQAPATVLDAAVINMGVTFVAYIFSFFPRVIVKRSIGRQ